MKSVIIKGKFWDGFFTPKRPYSTLTVDKNTLTIDIHNFTTKYVFRAQEIISINTDQNLISIKHRARNVRGNLKFYANKNCTDFINEIKTIGFYDKINPTISEQDKNTIKERDKFPFKLMALIPLLISISLTIVELKNESLLFPNKLTMIALFNLGINSILLLNNRKYKSLMMREGKTIADIDSFIYPLMAFSLVYTVVLFFKLYVL